MCMLLYFRDVTMVAHNLCHTYLTFDFHCKALNRPGVELRILHLCQVNCGGNGARAGKPITIFHNLRKILLGLPTHSVEAS